MTTPRVLHLLFVLVVCHSASEVREAQRSTAHFTSTMPGAVRGPPQSPQHYRPVPVCFANPPPFFLMVAFMLLVVSRCIQQASLLLRSCLFPLLYCDARGGVGPAGKWQQSRPSDVADRFKQKRNDCATDGILVATLENGVLKDGQGRTGYIAANYQFQFDQPAQTGAIFTAGFSACGNGSLALGGSAVFYECASGDFFNLYDRSWAAQCSPVEILIMECGGNAGQAGDGQVVGTQIVTTTIVSALSDGQPQVRTTTTGIPVCQVSQIADGKSHRTQIVAFFRSRADGNPRPGPGRHHTVC